MVIVMRYDRVTVVMEMVFSDIYIYVYIYVYIRDNNITDLT